MKYLEWGINNTLAELKKARRIAKKELRNYSEDRLSIVDGVKRTEFFALSYTDGKRIRKSIKGKDKQIYRLAHKAYLEELVRRIDANIRILECEKGNMFEISNEAIFGALPANFKILKQEFIISPQMVDLEGFCPHPVGDGSVKPIIMPERLSDYNRTGHRIMTPAEWFTLPYCENTSFPEKKKHIAYNGLRTRSKSEALLIGCYGAKEIFYHYDEMVIINGHLLSPDVIGLKPDGTFAIQEHAGLWSDNYIAHNRWKIDLYESAGFVLGKNLFFTFDDEDGNINTRLIDAMIDDMFGW